MRTRLTAPLFFLGLGLSLLAASFFAHPAAAAGEVYSWRDHFTLTIAGGGTRGAPYPPPYDGRGCINNGNCLNTVMGPANDPLPGGGYGMPGTLLMIDRVDGRGCLLNILITVLNFQTGQAQILLNGGPAGGAGGLPDCSRDLDVSGFNNKLIQIQGSRPDNGGAETEAQKRIHIQVLSSQVTPPSTTKLTLTNTDNGQFEQVDVPLNTGGSNDYQYTFDRDPGHYKICSDIVPDCKTFEKKIYTPTNPDPIVLGESLTDRSVRTEVHFHYIGLSNDPDIRFGPYDIALHRADGSDTGNTVQTNDTFFPSPGGGGSTQVDHDITLSSLTLNVEPGDYQVCMLLVTACSAKFTKAPSLQWTAIIELNEDQVRQLLAAAQPKNDTTVCDTGGGLGGVIGWFVCPLMQVFVDGTQFLQDTFIIPYLTVSPLTTEPDPQTHQLPIAYTLWKSFRDLANVLLVLVFFAVIFSQATSIGISNYGIKKILPRLALVAIGANLSFFIVAFVIDAFNIFGAGVATLVMSVVQVSDIGGNLHPVGLDQKIFWTIATPVFIAIAIKAGIFLKALIWLVGAIFIIVLTVVVVLVLRQMLILILVVLAPVAIVLYLLPNTESLYKKWQKLLIELLIMYPIIVLLFASGKIIGTFLASNLKIGG